MRYNKVQADEGTIDKFIGDTVNVAERIEGLTRSHKSSMFISAVLHDKALPLPETFEFDGVPGTKLHGRATAIDLLALSRINTGQNINGRIQVGASHQTGHPQRPLK